MASRPPENPIADATPTVVQAAKPTDEVAPGGDFDDDALTRISKPQPLPAAGPHGPPPLEMLVRGQRLAHFTLEDPIGVGGMATVLRAHDDQLDRTVALKILPPEMAADAENVRRFENEAKAAAKLDHENIARVFFYGQDQGLHFIAFEYVQGDNLRTLLDRQGGPFDVAAALTYGLQAAKGLAHAAQRGVVHRDIKPSNLVVTPEGRVKLIDMGLARFLQPTVNGELTQSGTTLGTFDYISPEQALDPRAADIRSDLYSLGCTLYHLLTGQPPVPPGTAARKLQAQQFEPPIDPRDLNPAIPDDVVEVLAKLMAKVPADRYQDPEKLVADLQFCLDRQNQYPQASPGSVQPGPARPGGESTPSAGWFLVALGLLAIMLTGLSLWPPPTQPARSVSNLGSAPASPTAIPDSDYATAEEQPAPATLAPRRVEARTAAEVRQVLAAPFQGTIVLRGEVFDFSADDGGAREGGMVIAAGSDVTLEGTAGLPVLRWRGSHGRTNQAPTTLWPAVPELPLFAIRGGSLTLRQVRLEVEPGAQPLGTVQLRGGDLVVEQCEFVQKLAAEPSANRAVTLRVAPLRGGVSRAAFRQTTFFGGAAGFMVHDAAMLTFEDCLIGPYRVPFQVRIRDGAGPLAPQLRMHHCTWILDVPGVDLRESRQPLEWSMRQCVVHGSADAEDGGEAALLRLPSGTIPPWQYRGEENLYLGLGALVLATDAEDTLTVLLPTLSIHDAAVRAAAGVKEWQDIDSRIATPAPAAEVLARGLRQGEPAATWRSAVRQLSSLSSSTDAEPRGVRSLLGQDLPSPPAAVPDPQAPVTEISATTRELTVDGQGLRPGHFSTLNSALGAIDSDGEAAIILKTNDAVAIRPEEIGSRKITIRAAPGFTPECYFNPDTVPGADGEVTLFRLHDGTLILEQLAFRIAPALKESPRFQSLVTITGMGRVRFKSCQATLAGDGDQKIALVAVADPASLMAGNRPNRSALPGVELEDCFVRGRGDVVAVRVSRPFSFEARQCAIAVQGTLLAVDGNRAEMLNATEPAVLSLDHVTAYTSQGLAVLRAAMPQTAHVQLRISAAASLLVTAEGVPLLRVEGPRAEQDLKRRVAWQGRRTVYGSSAALLLWHSLERMEMTHEYDAQRWGELWGREDEEPHFVREVTFAGRLDRLDSLTELQPSHLTVTAVEPGDVNIRGVGADLDRVFFRESRGPLRD